MSAAAVSLTQILHRADVWRGDRLAALDGQTQPSGFEALDAQLPGAGWPRGALVEFLAEQHGIGELALLLPALRAAAEEAPVAIVAPPGVAHAPAWAAALPLERLLCVDAPPEQAAWSVEHLLTSGALGALLAWLPARTGPATLRRLQLACEGHRGLVFLFRPSDAAQQASPAPLRLILAGHPAGLRVDILKRRGPRHAAPLILPVERPLPWARVALPSRPSPSSATVRSIPHPVRRRGEAAGVSP